MAGRVAKARQRAQGGAGAKWLRRGVSPGSRTAMSGADRFSFLHVACGVTYVSVATPSTIGLGIQFYHTYVRIFVRPTAQVKVSAN